MIAYLSSFLGAFVCGFFAAALFIWPLRAALEVRRVASVAADIRS